MQCTRPVRINNCFYPCGKCLACRISKAREWSARLMQELGYWDKAVFITLTYSDEFLPENGSLRKKDLQNFFKRLRKYSNARLKYYACGEYGSKTNRPHYHAIIFGLGQSEIDKEFIKDAWRKCIWDNFNEKKAFGTVTYDSCRYVSDYIFKKYSGEKAESEYLSQGREVPFKISSQGLGLRYCLDNAESLKFYKSFTLRGVPVGLPRYYVKKLELELEPQDEKNFLSWQKYARLKNVPLCDVAELKEASRRQRETDLERKHQLFKKGEF